MVNVQILTHVHLDHISVLGSIFITIAMTLLMNSDHISYYHMDATWSVGWLQTYFFLLFGCLMLDLCHIFISRYCIQTGPHAYHYVEFFWQGGLYAYGCSVWLHCGYSRPCWCCTTFHYNLSPALWIATTAINIHHANNVSGFNEASMQ